MAAVSTGFPAGLSPMEQRVDEIAASVGAGAAEIDIVITRAHVLTGNWEALYGEVRRFREACGDAHMKAILATGELATLGNVARASMVAMQAGADFIKTSTGKEGVNATLPFGLVMCRMIREYFEQTGYAIGFKPAGGIRSAKQALEFLYLMKEELGDRWLRADLFRFGASALLTDIERQLLEHFVTGPWYACRGIIGSRCRRHAESLFCHPRVSFCHPESPSVILSEAKDLLFMASVADIFHTMEYGPAPESAAEARTWLTRHNRLFGHFIGGAVGLEPGAGNDPRSALEVANPATWRNTRARGAGLWCGCPRRGFGSPDRARPLAGALGPRPRATSLRARSRRAETCPAAGGRRDDGQRQVDPRDARYRHSIGGASLLPPRGLGAIARHGVLGIPRSGCRRTDHPVEFPAPDAGVEGCTGAGRGLYGRAQTCGVHAAHRALLRRDRRARWIAAGGAERADGRRSHRRSAGRSSRRGQDRVYRLDRGGSDDSAGDRHGSGKKLSLELGGKSPFLVYEDADLDSAVEGVVDAIWFNQGQVCCAGSRLLVQEGVAARLIEKLRARMERLRLGSPARQSRSTWEPSSLRCNWSAFEAWCSRG